MSDQVGGERKGGFVLADAEKRLLVSWAKKLPRSVLPDDLTIIGIFSAAAICACYWASNSSRFWLLAVIPLFFLHWIGDSLDGTLARVRKITRPRYGYYLDHIVDAFSTALIGLGLGLSPYLFFPVAALAVIAYLILSINVYLEGETFKRFEIGYGQMGPTEMRLALIAITLTLFFTGPLPLDIFGYEIAILNLIIVALILFMITALLLRVTKNLRELAKDEPAAPRH